jgi:hypothetical protein
LVDKVAWLSPSLTDLWVASASKVRVVEGAGVQRNPTWPPFPLMSGGVSQSRTGRVAGGVEQRSEVTVEVAARLPEVDVGQARVE